MRRKVAAGASAILGIALLATGCAAEEELPPPPAFEELSAAEEDALYQETVDSYGEYVQAAFPEAQLPEVERIRFVTREEWNDVFVSCLGEAGFEATVHEDGGVRYGEIPPEQAEAQAIANYICRAQYPTESKYSAPFSDAQVSWLYEYTKTTLFPCLEAFDARPDNMPSEELFRQAISGTGEGVWDVYSQVPVENIDQAIEECPQFPDEFWGD